MSRRDTILIAVLINAGLLVILFATAITARPKDALSSSAAQQMVHVAPPAPTPVQEVSRSFLVREEVDQVIADYQAEKEENPFVATVVEQQPAPDALFVTVKRGDSLDKIARANGATVEQLMSRNNLSTTRLQIGQVLEVPIAEEVPDPAPVVHEAFYTVESGDSPWTIAMKHKIPLDELLAINNLDESSARRLKPGDQIRIR